MTTIFLYHEIADLTPDQDPPGLAVSPRVFRKHMEYLARNNFRCLSLDQVVENRSQNGDQHNTFVLTFDDGFQDFYTTAWPILDEYHFTATVFQVVGCTGSNSNWEGSSGNQSRPLMTWEHIRELADHGMTIGSHTMTHPRLANLPLDAARDEIGRSKHELEDHLGRAVEFFSYPYASRTPAVRQLVEELGYRGVCVDDRGRWDRFNMWRVQCARDETRLSFVLKARGIYDRVAWLREETVIGAIVRRWVRRVRAMRQSQR